MAGYAGGRVLSAGKITLPAGENAPVGSRRSGVVGAGSIHSSGWIGEEAVNVCK